MLTVEDFRQRWLTFNPLTPILQEDVLLPERVPLSAAAEAFVEVLRPYTHEGNAVPRRIAQGEPMEDVLDSAWKDAMGDAAPSSR